MCPVSKCSRGLCYQRGLKSPGTQTQVEPEGPRRTITQPSLIPLSRLTMIGLRMIMAKVKNSGKMQDMGATKVPFHRGLDKNHRQDCTCLTAAGTYGTTRAHTMQYHSALGQMKYCHVRKHGWIMRSSHQAELSQAERVRLR